MPQVDRVQKTAAAVAQVDVLNSFAAVAAANYCMPQVDAPDRPEHCGGPPPGGGEDAQRAPLSPTTPTWTAGTTCAPSSPAPTWRANPPTCARWPSSSLMAQMGSFVPAKSAHIGVVDRVFTRIGASDDLSAGQSTFMVEMTEVADLLKNATSQSLLILDEIGRGTSTYDGMAIARAVLEYCADKRRLGAKTLFATHYHELTALEGRSPG